MASIDSADMRQLAADMGSVPSEVEANTVKALNVTSFKIRSAWREKLRGSSTLPALPYAVTFDAKQGRGVLESEIGFDKGRAQGALGNISEFGSVNNAPRGFGAAALAENAEDFVTGILLASDSALKDARL